MAHEFQSAQSSADSISASINRQITLVRGIPVVMALEPWLAQQLSTKFGPGVHRSLLSMAEQGEIWLADPQLGQLARTLRDIVDRIGLSSLFVMNAAGDCVAEGHSGNSNGFTGANYADREYFLDAQKGQMGQQFAVGRVSSAYALFYSAPVILKNQFVGAVATRIDLEKAAQTISEKDFFITDENGVIVLAKDPDLVMRAVPNAKIFEISNQDRATRYKRQQFLTVDLHPVGDKAPAQLFRWKSARLPYVLATQHSSDNLLTIYVLKDLEVISNIRSERIWWFSLAALTGLATLLLVTGALLFLQRKRAHFQELAQINALLQAGNERLARRNDEQDRFLSMLSHELKTPLAVIRMSLGTGGTIDESSRKRLIRAVADINAIVERCLQTDRLEHGRIEVAQQTCNPGDILRQIIVASSETERICFEAPPLPDCVTDAQLLTVILANLIDNALKYSPGDTLVNISAEPTAQAGKDGLSIIVTNRPGPAGMPDPQQVFQRYYRAPGAHGKTGSGLGLHIAEGFARMLDGKLSYQPEADTVKFTLWMPR